MWDHRSGRGLVRMSVFAALILLLCGCGQTETPDDLVIIEQETPEISYETALVQVGTVEKTSKVSCTYRQVDEQEVAFQITGRMVDRVHVKEGDKVKKGDLLVELSSEDLERRIEDLQYNIARNELLLGYVETNEEISVSGLWVNYLNFGGDRTNLDQSIENTQQNYRYQREDYEDALAADKAELAQIQTELKNSRIYASMDGTVYDMKEDLDGSTSRLGEVVMTIMDTSELLFETKVDNAVQYFREDEPVSMSISYGSAAGEYKLLPWHMEQWGETQMFVVYESPEDATLEVGVTGTIQVAEQKKENVLYVPSEAVHNAEEERYVYVQNDNDTREVRWIKTGLYGNGIVEVLSGLEEGEKVILK